jgi:hypothetical protein
MTTVPLGRIEELVGSSEGYHQAGTWVRLKRKGQYKRPETSVMR